MGPVSEITESEEKACDSPWNPPRTSRNPSRGIQRPGQRVKRPKRSDRALPLRPPLQERPPRNVHLGHLRGGDHEPDDTEDAGVLGQAQHFLVRLDEAAEGRDQLPQPGPGTSARARCASARKRNGRCS